MTLPADAPARLKKKERGRKGRTIEKAAGKELSRKEQRSLNRALGRDIDKKGTRVMNEHFGNLVWAMRRYRWAFWFSFAVNVAFAWWVFR